MAVKKCTNMNILELKKYDGSLSYENYHTEYSDKDDAHIIETKSLEELERSIIWAEENAKLNETSIADIPVFIECGGSLYTINSFDLSWGEEGMRVKLCTSKKLQLHYVAPDSRPDNGEYWRSRGVGGGECSGFVVSKAAGERLRRMVNLVLENDTPKSHLDYREYEPNRIQFKFNENEFNLSDLDVMTRENDNTITLDILYKCKLKEYKLC